jgi:DNA processing protein
VLAALSRAVVVVEAARRSGALITVDHALDLGLEVFAVPGSVETPQAEGANRLLRDGAHVLTDVGELLEVMGWDRVGERRASPAGRPEAEPGSAERTRLTGCLGTVPRSLDQLVMAAHLPAARVLSLLTALEMEGVARREPAGWTATVRREPRA